MKYDDEATSQPKQQVGLGIPGYDRATTMLKLRHGVSALSGCTSGAGPRRGSV